VIELDERNSGKTVFCMQVCVCAQLTVDIGDGSSVEIVDEFCYLRNTFSVHGDATLPGFAVQIQVTGLLSDHQRCFLVAARKGF